MANRPIGSVDSCWAVLSSRYLASLHVKGLRSFPLRQKECSFTQSDFENKSRERTFGGLWYCQTRNHVVDSANKTLTLRPKTLDVFRYLSEHSDTVVSRSELLDAVWPDSHVTEDSLTQCVSEIRKLYRSDATNILQTVPKRGYQLNSDLIDIDLELDSASTESGPSPRAWNHRKSLLAVLATLLLGSVVVYQVGFIDSGDGTETSSIAEESQSAISSAVEADLPTQSNVNQTDPNLSAPSVLLKVHLGSESSDIDAVLLQDALRLSMGRYKTIQLVEKGEADFSLEVGVRADADAQSYVMMILKDTVQGFEVLAERIDPAPGKVNTSRLASRIAAMIASPATGAVGRHILQSSRSKPVQELTRAECYAHGYDCTNCSGELDTVDTRAQSCLASILEKDNEDVRAWGLQSTIYAKQYQWSTNLGEPLRTDVRLREPIVDKAIAAANRAEQLSDGTDSAVYWGMAQAYLTACDIPKMQTAMQRGLQINPEDPGMLGTSGNWLAYSGEWDAGTEMVMKAIAIEPKHYKRWWLFAPAKRHYIRGEFEQALAYFEQAFNERNWLSHLQMAYTLPYLDRHEEARAAAKKTAIHVSRGQR